MCLFVLVLLMIDDDATRILETTTRISMAHGFSTRHSENRPRVNGSQLKRKKNKEKGRFLDNEVDHARRLPPRPPSILPDPRTIKNPHTNRQIMLGGPTYQNLIKEGTWIEHNGSFHQLDLKMLAKYQQGCTTHQPDGKTKNAADNNGIHTDTKNHWYCIIPSVIIDDDNFESTSKASIPKRRKSRSLSQKERSMLNEEIVFVYKPSGMNCVPARHEDHNNSNSLATKVMNLLGPNAKLCHRLDRDTSGIIIVGLTKSAHRNVSKQFENRTTKKTYIALIAGHPTNAATSTSKSSGLINLPIGKFLTSEGYNRWVIGGDKPREAITTYRVLEEREFDIIENCTASKPITASNNPATAKLSRLELIPQTGRGHQLRLHMKAGLGCPIIGDHLHGVETDTDANAGSHNLAIALCAPRLCLHAWKIEVDWNGLRLEAVSPEPF